MKRLYEDTRETVQWLFVYILEAHASDEWPIGSSVVIPQHKTIADRADACAMSHRSLALDIPVVLDSIDNSFNRTYAAWPFKFYLIDNGIIEYIPVLSDASYDEMEIVKWLRSKTK